MRGSADESQRGGRAVLDELLPGCADAGSRAELDYLCHAIKYVLLAEVVCALPHGTNRRPAHLAAMFDRSRAVHLMRIVEKRNPAEAGSRESAGDTFEMQMPREFRPTTSQPKDIGGFHAPMFAIAHTPEIRRASLRRMTDRRREWQRFLDENAYGSAEYRAAREAAARRFHEFRFAEEEPTLGNSPEKKPGL